MVGGAVGVNVEVAANAVTNANVAAATMGVTAAIVVLILYPFNVPEFLKNSPVKTLELE